MGPIIFAYAEGGDGGSPQTIVLFLMYAAVIAGVCLLTCIPIALARHRRRAKSETVLTLAIFWALITAVTLIDASVTQFNWNQERVTRLSTGYADHPDDAAPRPPWNLLEGLAGAYFVIVIWAGKKV